MNFAQAIASGFKNFVNFKGGATRSEYWYFVLFTVLVGVVLSTIESIIWPAVQTVPDFTSAKVLEQLQASLNQPTPLSDIAGFILLLPQLSLLVRRMHDAGFSAKWLFLYLIPVVLTAVAAILAFTNQSGPDLNNPQYLLLTILFVALVLLLTALAVGIFFLVVTLKPSKSAEAGNKYLK